MLRAAAHPGVVAVVGERWLDEGDGGFDGGGVGGGVDGGGAGFELELAVAGTRTAADVRGDGWVGASGVAGVAGLVAALATTVADLHQLGIVHGRIRPEHVVIDGTGRPVLCGFGGAGRVGAVPPRGTAPLAPPDDAADLGALLADLLGATDPGAAGDRPRRRGAGRGGLDRRGGLGRSGGRGRGAGRLGGGGRRRGRGDPRRAAAARRSLLALAAQAGAPDPARRPTARAFAAAILATAPDAHLPTPLAPTTTPELAVDPEAHDQRFDRGFAGSASRTQLDFAGSGSEPEAGRSGGSRLATQTELAVDSEAHDPRFDRGFAGGSRAAVVAAAAVGAGLLGFGVVALLRPGPTTVDQAAPRGATTTSETAVVVGGGVVERGGARYGVGEPGDVLAVGDWDCDGLATVAVVRPTTGAVYVFEGWPEPGRDETVERAATVPGAAAVSSEAPEPDGCRALVVVDGAGGRTEVPT